MHAQKIQFIFLSMKYHTLFFISIPLITAVVELYVKNNILSHMTWLKKCTMLMKSF